MREKVNKKSFVGQSFYAGIDFHKKSWKVTIMSEHLEHKIMSQDPNPEVLSNYLKRNFPGGNYYAVYEAGFSGFEACRKLNSLGVQCSLIHPADVPTSHKEKLQKTDKADSRKLARMLRGNEFESIHIPDRKLEADRALVRQRFKILKDLGRYKNRIKSMLFQFGIDIPDMFTVAQTRYWPKAYVNWLKDLSLEQTSIKNTLDNYIRIGEFLREELLFINRQVRELSQSKDYKTNYDFLVSIPGVGLMTAITFLVQIGKIDRFPTLDELCNYVGLVPSMYGSGDKMQTGKLINRGRKELKIMLIEASWIAVKHDPALMHKFDELSKRMNKNKAIIRIAKKLLSRMRYVLQHQEKYELGVVR
ncbi:IS110 family transposase [Bacteroidota bacterium]